MALHNAVMDSLAHYIKQTGDLLDRLAKNLPVLGVAACAAHPSRRINARIIRDLPLFYLGDGWQSLADILDRPERDGLPRLLSDLAAVWEEYYQTTVFPIREGRIGRVNPIELGYAYPEDELLALRLVWCDRAKLFLEGQWGEPTIHLFLAEVAKYNGLDPAGINVNLPDGQSSTLEEMVELDSARFRDFASVYHEAHIVFDTDLKNERDEKRRADTIRYRRHSMPEALRDAVQPMRHERRAVHGDTLDCGYDDRYEQVISAALLEARDDHGIPRTGGNRP
jgi:hypothetical protein